MSTAERAEMEAVSELQITQLTDQRDALLAALIELRDWYKENVGLPAVNANAAIALAEGRAHE